MSILKLIPSALSAMKSGQIIVHPERWKSAQALSMALAAIVVPLYAAFCDSPSSCYGLGPDDAKNIAIWAGGFAFAAFQIWSTLATTTKIGIGKKTGPSNPAGHDDLRESARSSGSEQVSPEIGGITESAQTSDQREYTFDKDVYGSFKSD